MSLSDNENDSDRAAPKVAKPLGQWQEQFLGQRLELVIRLDGQRRNLSRIQ